MLAGIGAFDRSIFNLKLPLLLFSISVDTLCEIEESLLLYLPFVVDTLNLNKSFLYLNATLNEACDHSRNSETTDGSSRDSGQMLLPYLACVLSRVILLKHT